MNYPSLCTTNANHPSLIVTIGPCVVTSYTAVTYADFTYNIGTGTATTPYPSFIRSPACTWSESYSTTVNSDPFPGVNLVGGGSMSAIFGEDAANQRFTIVDADLNDGTNTYTFQFTSTLTANTPIISA